MSYRPLTELADLPPEGPLSNVAREKHDLEFKSAADRATPWEHAKDIAALANSLGGTILVGVSNSIEVTLHGLREQTDREVMDIYEDAAMKCSPVVPIDPVPITLPSGMKVVAVNVPPYPEALVGSPGAAKVKNREASAAEPGTGNTSEVTAPSQKPTYLKAENAWRFPIRRASQTHYLTPEDLPVYMNPQVRRAYVRLTAIPAATPGFTSRRVRLFFRRPDDTGRGLAVVQDELDVQLNDVSLEKNAISVRYFNKRGSNSVRIPLMDVEDVWELDHDSWGVRVRGWLALTDEVEMPNARPYFKLTYTLLH